MQPVHKEELEEFDKTSKQIWNTEQYFPLHQLCLIIRKQYTENQEKN